MDKLDRFISKHLLSVSYISVFTVIINVIAILSVYVGWEVRWIMVIICDCLLLYGWIYLFRRWKQFK